MSVKVLHALATSTVTAAARMGIAPSATQINAGKAYLELRLVNIALVPSKSQGSDEATQIPYYHSILDFSHSKQPGSQGNAVLSNANRNRIFQVVACRPHHRNDHGYEKLPSYRELQSGR